MVLGTDSQERSFRLCFANLDFGRRKLSSDPKETQLAFLAFALRSPCPPGFTGAPLVFVTSSVALGSGVPAMIDRMCVLLEEEQKSQGISFCCRWGLPLC